MKRGKNLAGDPPVAATETGYEQRRLALADEIAGLVLAEGLGTLGLRGLADRIRTSGRMLLYYFQTKELLVIAVLACVNARLTNRLAEYSSGPAMSPSRFFQRVMELAQHPDMAPFMRLWTEVIARGARGEAPFDQVAAKIVHSWVGWIESRLEPSPQAKPGRAAAILSLVEGTILLEMACPGSTEGVQAYISKAFDDESQGG